MQTPNYDNSYYLLGRLVKNNIKPYRNKIILAVICMLFAAGSTAMIAYLLRPTLDSIFVDKDYSMLQFIPIVILITFTVQGFATYGKAFLIKFIGMRIISDMQTDLYKHLLYSDIAMLSKEASGKIISRFTNDISVMRRCVSSIFTSSFQEFFTLIALVGVMFYQNYLLALIAFAAFPTAIYPIIRLGKRMRKISSSTQEQMGTFTERLDETFKGFRVIKSYRQEQSEIKRASKTIEDLFNLYVKAARVESLSSPIMEMLAGFVIAAVIWYGGHEVLKGTTSPGAFTSFIAAFILAYKPLKSLSGLNIALQEGLASAKRLFMLLDQKPTITDSDNATQLTLKGGNISLINVSFKYSPKKPALYKLSLEIPQGKTVALVGPSGGGKSTIMNLILRFYDPDKGRIEIDGQNIREVTQDSLRDNIAIVSQETMLFDDTIAKNIAYSKEDASIEEIIAAAKAASAHEFIEELPDGYNTKVGQNGFTLSGGQRQRLSIARAMLKDAPILLLDEATSALDNISEKKIQEGLNNLMRNRTTLVIAHRLSTIQHADIIYVLKKGYLVETGTHDSLMKLKGEYAKLYNHSK